MSDQPMPPATPRGRGWLWFFGSVTALTVLAVAILVWFGRRQLEEQLTPKQLEAARALWAQHGPRDYRLRYTVTIGHEGRTDTYESEVRGGKAVAVVMNGERLHLRSDQHIYHDMPGLFQNIDDFLKLDAKPNRPRTFARAVFDATDGHLRQYRRHVLSGRERQEIVVEELTPLSKN